jgi:hypothetical protein
MAVYVYSVEACDDRDNWVVVETYYGEENEAGVEAAQKMQSLERAGWPKSLLRTTKSRFSSLDKKFRED